MSWKIAAGLTLVAIAPLSAQRSDRRHDVRVDIPPVVVDVPRVKVDIPSFNFTMPAINLDIPSFNFAVPAINIDIPSVRIDLSGFEQAMDEVRASIEAVGDIDVYYNSDQRQVSRVRNLMREWRQSVRNAEDTGDWEQADDLARELSRAADRLSPGELRVIKRSSHRTPRS